jgi:hypothetical protein
VQPDARRAGTAVVEKRDRPALHVLAVLRVRHEEHPRRDLAVVEADRQRAGRRGVLDFVSVEAGDMRRLRGFLIEGRGNLDAGLLPVRGLIARLWRRRRRSCGSARGRLTLLGGCVEEREQKNERDARRE